MILSIIIPCYKVEEYLAQCIESVCHNKTDDLEVILVDDGSPDRTPIICDQWAENDDRIKVIHQTNGGLSVARNAGMDLAKGDYIWFIDSDDWIKKNAIEQVFSLINQHPDIDVFVTPLTWTYDDERKNWLDIIVDQNTIYKGENYISKFPIATGATPRNIIKRKVLESANMRFLPNITHEDALFGLILYNQSKSVMVLKNSIYYYRQRNGSIMHSININSAYSIITIHKELMKYMQKHISPQKHVIFQRRYIYMFKWAISITWGLRKKNEFKIFLKDTRNYRISKCMECAKSTSYFYRAEMYLLAYHPIIYVYVHDWRKMLYKEIKYSIKKILMKTKIFDILYDFWKGDKKDSHNR